MSAFYDHAPLWAWLVGMVLMVPAAWLGANLRVKRTGPCPHAAWMKAD
jgi:hypothetical protein